MKKILLIVVGVLVIGGAVVVSQMYTASESAKLVKDLAKFEVSDDENFEVFLNAKRLKWRKWFKTERETKKKGVPEPAPLYALKVKGKDIIGEMASIANDASQSNAVRYAAVIVLAHTKKKDAIDPLIEGLKASGGRLGECSSVMLNLLGYEEVPARIAEVLSSGSDPVVRKNAFRAITFWVTKDKKRQENEVPMEEVIKGLDEKAKDTLLLILGNTKRLQFRFAKKKNEKESVGARLSAKLLPMIGHDDEEIAKAATDALVFQYSYMDDPKKVETIKVVAPYMASERKKHVRLNAVKVISKLNFELADTKANIGKCDLEPLIPLLDFDDPDLLNPVLDTFARCGTERQHRLAVQKFKERIQDEVLKKKAQETIEKIADREEEE